MTPERHDDVEDVVGRARGDVTPEETHEPSLLVPFVEKDTACRVDSFEVGQVHAHPLAEVEAIFIHITEPPPAKVCVSRRGNAQERMEPTRASRSHRPTQHVEAPAGTSIEERFDAPGILLSCCSVEKWRDPVLVLAVDIGASSDERTAAFPAVACRGELKRSDAIVMYPISSRTVLKQAYQGSMGPGFGRDM